MYAKSGSNRFYCGATTVVQQFMTSSPLNPHSMMTSLTALDVPGNIVWVKYYMEPYIFARFLQTVTRSMKILPLQNNGFCQNYCITKYSDYLEKSQNLRKKYKDCLIRMLIQSPWNTEYCVAVIRDRLAFMESNSESLIQWCAVM